jgi:DNA processing protein
MAMGIDTAAHRGALAAKGRTIAILGSGLNWIYPRRNLSLFNEICRTGAVISDFPPDTRPEPKNFPIRNRIIAGVSTGTIVVEAAVKSGSLITARLAADFSREVFAVPGSISSQRSHGTHALIRQGATLVENYGDIIQELHHMIHVEPAFSPSPSKDKNEQKLKLNKVEQAIVSVLGPYPLHIDKIVEQTDLDISAVSATLLDLELNGMVKQLKGKLFSIKEE